MPTQKKVFLQEAQKQMFQITVRGLNVNSRMRVFFEGAEVTPALGVLTKWNDSIDITTDRFGVLYINYYYQDAVSYVNFTDEESLFRFAQANQGVKLLTIVDAASISSAVYTQLPSNYRELARCFAEIPIRVSYVATVKEINYSDYTEAALASTSILQTREFNAPAYWQNGSEQSTQIILGS